MPETLAVLNMLGIIVFAISGALAAARARMDPFGFVVLATVTGIGGGTLRDLLLGVRPVGWVERPGVIVLCAGAGLAMYLVAPTLRPMRSLLTAALVWADAVGLAVFAVSGTQMALREDAPAITAIAMGVVTAIGGGIARDLLTHEPPLVLHREIYALAAMVGGLVAWALDALGTAPVATVALACLVAFAARAAGIVFGWSLPTYRGSPGT